MHSIYNNTHLYHFCTFGSTQTYMLLKFLCSWPIKTRSCNISLWKFCVILIVFYFIARYIPRAQSWPCYPNSKHVNKTRWVRTVHQECVHPRLLCCHPGLPGIESWKRECYVRGECQHDAFNKISVFIQFSVQFSKKTLCS